MSDPAANFEIEDVLSSIRRLVSEETRTGKPATSKTSGKRVGRLVLTPALRVSDPIEDVAQDKAQEAPKPMADPAAPWKDPEARLFDAGPVEEAPSAPEGDVPPEFRSERSAATTGDTESEAPADVDDTESDAPAPGIGPLEITDHFEFIDQHSTHVLPPEKLPDPVQDEDAAEERELSEDHAGTADTQHETDASGEADRPEMAEPDAASLKSDELASKIEALETAICRSEEEWEPDGSSDEPYSGTRVERLDWSKGDAIGQDHDDLSAPVSKPGQSDSSEQPTVDKATLVQEEPVERGEKLASGAGAIDEDALRELVAEIVRQELQGALGERITRNVRKLVRREIHRALSAQSLD